MKPRAIVFGGSFNPPTKAHLAIMAAALDGIGASMGVFVPSSGPYVERKAGRQGAAVFSPEERYAMLSAMAATDPRMRVDDLEYADPDCRGRTYKTLCEIQDKYPDHEVWFLTGADKLHIIGRWRSSEDLLSKFHVLAMSRGKLDPSALVASEPALAPYADRFLCVESPDAADGISSSAFQKLWKARSPESMELLHPEAKRVLEALRSPEKGYR